MQEAHPCSFLRIVDHCPALPCRRPTIQNTPGMCSNVFSTIHVAAMPEMRCLGEKREVVVAPRGSHEAYRTGTGVTMSRL